jgi:hypothetical protein
VAVILELQLFFGRCFPQVSLDLIAAIREVTKSRSLSGIWYIIIGSVELSTPESLPALLSDPPHLQRQSILRLHGNSRCRLRYLSLTHQGELKVGYKRAGLRGK